MSPTFTDLDALVGPFGSFTDLDAAVKTLDLGTFTDLDALVSGRTFTDLDALVSDPRGAYRGVVADTTERDALGTPQPGDVVDVTQGAEGRAERHIRSSDERLVIAQTRGTGDTYPIDGTSTNAFGLAQSFQVPGICTLTAIDVVAARFGSPVDDLKCTVQAQQQPDSALSLVDDTIAGSALSTTPAWVRYDFGAGIVLDPTDPQSVWAFRLERTGAADGSNCYVVGVVPLAPFDMYPGGILYVNQAAAPPHGAWSYEDVRSLDPNGNAYSDLMFRLHITTDAWGIAKGHDIVSGGVASRADTLVRDTSGTKVFQQAPIPSPDEEDI